MTRGPDHQTHDFHGTPEGYLCRDCDARPGRADSPCPAFMDEVRAAHASVARLLLRSLPPGPLAPAPDAGDAAMRAYNYALEDWQGDLTVREASCRTLGRMLGLDVDPDATLPVMSKP